MVDKLALVNHLLQTVGERRVLTLETGHPSVTQAVQALESYDEDFQGRGWWFNRNQAMKLLPNNLGQILLPKEALSFQVTHVHLQNLGPSEKARYTRRGGMVYDSVLNTNIIGKPIVADLIVRLDIEDLPSIAASYLKHWAAENYYVDDDGDNQKSNKLGERRMLAFHALKAEELRVEATNALDSPAAQHLTHRVGQAQGNNPVIPGGRYSR